jgi:inhibitor of cysteine peptidase
VQGGAKVFGKEKLRGSIVAAFLIVAVLTAGCGPAKDVNFGADVVRADVKEINVAAKDNGGRVDLALGQVLVVTLASNPTTGYSWQVVDAEGSILRQMGEAEFVPQSDLMGAPGVETLRFEPTGAGQTTLQLVYHRPWEKDVEPLETFSLQVTVH